MMPTTTFTPSSGRRPPWRRALVTGGAGFLGSHLCTRLLRSGVEVDCLDDLTTGRPGNVEHLAGEPGFRYLHLDIADPRCADTATGPYDLVLHLAGPGAPADCRRRPLKALDTAGLGTRTALALADRDVARFLLASSAEASESHGDGRAAPPWSDDSGADGAADEARDPVSPLHAYAEAARFAEALVTAHAGARGSDAGIVRVYPSYGPRMRTDDGRTVAAFLDHALAGAPLTVPGDGSRPLSLCYADDTAEGVLLVAAGRSVRPVDIGGDPGPTVAEVARAVLELTGSPAPLEFTDAPPGPAGARLDGRPDGRGPDTGFARELFGWVPRTSWREGLPRTVAAVSGRRPGPAAVSAAGQGAGGWRP
ncbi:NAD-dependent epimerase/dehydratase family protein [Streptomyces sp. NPDC006997]|uniref:NAD-dependent epimerase/dehydratase family protein n=1 Tax=Streptomyces sp. NPDC006997 TaxID=3155356 RepID=UPI0033D54B72